MVFTVRFSWQHDLDLIALSVNPNFSIGVEIKRAVTAYSRGEPLVIKLPPPLKEEDYYELDNCSTHFYLDEEKDKDVIEALRSIKCGHTNSAIKNIFRHYLENPMLDPYFNEKNYKVKTRVRIRGRKKKTDGRVIQKPRIPAPSMPVQKKESVKKPSSASTKHEDAEEKNKNIRKPDATETKDKNIRKDNITQTPTTKPADGGFDIYSAITGMF